MRRRVTALLVAFLLLAGASPAWAAVRSVRRPPTPTAPPGPPPPPKGWILVDDDTGAVIDAGNGRVSLRPASVSKIITALIAVEQLPADAEVPVSPLAEHQQARSINMKAGQVWRFTDVLHALLLVSANDAAVAVAARLTRCLDAFAAQMARTAGSTDM